MKIVWVVVFVLLSALPSFSQTRQNATDFYFSGSLGAIIPATSDVKVAGVSGELSANAGVMGSGAIGYRFGPFLAVEGEIGYSKFSYDKLNIAGLLASVDGGASTITGFANLIVTPLGWGRFSPYIGGGVGLAYSRSDINSLSAAGITLPVDKSVSKTGFAANAIAGLDYAVNDRLTIGAQYRLIWADTSKSWEAYGVSVEQSNLLAHGIMFNVLAKF